MPFHTISLAAVFVTTCGCGPTVAMQEKKTKEEKAQELFKADLTRSDMLGWASLPTFAEPGKPPKEIKPARFKGSKATVVVSERWFGLEPPERRQMIQQVADAWAKAREQAGFTGDDIRAPITLIASGGSTQGTWEPGSGPKAWGVQ